MADTFAGHASVTINAPRAKVWDAFVTPETIMQYMPVTSVVSEWKEGSPIVWTSEFQDKPFKVEGTVVRVEPDRLLEYDHSLPIFRSPGVAHSREQRRVTIELRDSEAQTHVAVTEQGNKNKREFEHSEGSWRMALNAMKALLEGTRV